MTTTEQLRNAIYATQEGKDLADQLIQLLERNYHCEANFYLHASNIAMGEVARALSKNCDYSDAFERYNLSVIENENSAFIYGPITPRP
jgi:hypothetical protein